ncbi:MAG: aspartyl protease family protein [Candidatus Bathyarchaeia archaeon]
MPLFYHSALYLGFVRVKCLFGSANRKIVKEVEFLTDTGAFYTTIPPELAEELSIKSIATMKLMLADKRIVEAGISLAYIKILDREGIFNIAIMDVPEPLLGVSTLEGLGVRIDPTTGKVEYSRPYGLAVL